MHTQEVQLRTSLYSVYTSLSLRTGFDAIRSRASPFRLILLTSGCIVEYATYIARERYKVPLSGYIPSALSPPLLAPIRDIKTQERRLVRRDSW